MMIGIILAAGMGTRMKREEAKVLVDLNGEILCLPSILSMLEVCEKVLIVIGYRGIHVKEAITQSIQHRLGDSQLSKIQFVTQETQKGTGHALQIACEKINLSQQNDEVIVCNGDVGLMRASSIRELVEVSRSAGVQSSCASMILSNPAGLGRIRRDTQGNFLSIREEKDANHEEKKIQEVNGGLYYFKTSLLSEKLKSLNSQNAQGEFYITDLLGSDKLIQSKAHLLSSPQDLLGANDFWELAELRRISKERFYKELATQKGVDFIDPNTTYISKSVKIEGKCTIGPMTVIQGNSMIHEGVVIDGNVYLNHVHISKGAKIRWGVVADGAVIGSECKVGPMAHLRPSTILEEKVSIGNFVELKKTTMGRGSKANHLTYLGDTEVGEGSNIGCGTITCNYDGFLKHKTKIGKNAFIGSDTQLVAPVEVGDGAYVASGTTVTEDVPSGALAIARNQLTIKEGYAEKLSKKIKTKSEG